MNFKDGRPNQLYNISGYQSSQDKPSNFVAPAKPHFLVVATCRGKWKLGINFFGLLIANI